MKNQGGYTLIELLTVVMIMTLLTVAGIGIYTTIRSRNLVKTSTGRILVVLSKARANALHGRQGVEWCVKFNQFPEVDPIKLDSYDAADLPDCPDGDPVEQLTLNTIRLDGVPGTNLDNPLVFMKDGSVKVYTGSLLDIDGSYAFDVSGPGVTERIAVYPNGLIERTTL